MMLLGVDYGRRKVGLALAQAGLASPLKVVKNDSRLIKKLEALIKKHGVEGVVVGLPEGELVVEIKRFVEIIRNQFSLPVELEPETLTSLGAIDKMVQAKKKRRFRQEMEDAVAAALILESYLEKHA